MTIGAIYNLGLKMGQAADPRGAAGVKRYLSYQKKKYDKLSKDEKEFFDSERLTNPYADSRLLFGDPKKKVKTVVCGIDIDVGEIALVKSLELKPDLIIAHHPLGRALAALDEVMQMQADMLSSCGVPINVAEGVMAERIRQVGRSLSAANHRQTVDAAALAGLPLLNLHTPTDNLVFDFLEKLMAKKQPETVGDIIDILRQVPEYKQAAANSAGPAIFAGEADNRAGRIVTFDITGGTSGAKEIYPELVRAGAGTIIGMHLPEESREIAAKNHLNIVIAGHISSDSLGMNLFLDELEGRGIKIIPLSGLMRVKRSKK